MNVSHSPRPNRRICSTSFCCSAWLAFSGLRYVIWDVLLLAVLTASLLVDWDRRSLDLPVREGKPMLNRGISVFLLFLSLTCLYPMRRGSTVPFSIHSLPHGPAAHKRS